MATILLIIIYIAFISLGIPDPLFGTAWPAIYQEMNLPLSYATFVSITISLCTMTSSLLAPRVIKKLGTGKVVAISTTLTAIALLLFSITSNFFAFIVFAIPLGFGAGAIDTSLNNYVSVHYKATHMSFLHCFYGIGITLSPIILSLTLKDNNWRKGYFIAFLIQITIAIITILALPLWKKCQNKTVNNELLEESVVVPLKTLAKNKLVRITWVLFMASCGIEFVCANWGSSYMVITRGLPVDKGASLIMFYFMGVATGRFLSGILAKKLSSFKIIFLGQGFVGLALILLFLPLPKFWLGISFFLIGFGNGPFFPNLVYLTPHIYGKDKSASVIGTILAFSSIGTMLIPALFGFLADLITIKLFPYYQLGLYLILIIGLSLLIVNLRKGLKLE